MLKSQTNGIIMKVFLLSLTVLFSICLKAQNNIGIKYFGLSIHPKGEHENSFLMPNKLDKNGYLVMNFGAVVSYEYFIVEERVSLKIAQSQSKFLELSATTRIIYKNKAFAIVEATNKDNVTSLKMIRLD